MREEEQYARQQPPDGGPVLISAREAAAMCGRSLRTWRAWDAIGHIPRPMRIGRSVLWRAEELKQWIAAGCPRREAWEAKQDTRKTV